MVIFSAFPLGVADSNTEATGAVVGTAAAELCTGAVELGTAGSAMHKRIKIHDKLLVCCATHPKIFSLI